jgi:hypothetical protein
MCVNDGYLLTVLPGAQSDPSDAGFSFTINLYDGKKLLFSLP